MLRISEILTDVSYSFRGGWAAYGRVEGILVVYVQIRKRFATLCMMQMWQDKSPYRCAACNAEGSRTPDGFTCSNLLVVAALRAKR